TDYLWALQGAPDLFREAGDASRRRRRAVRQACALRRHYEMHPVPDMPTSPGENSRVLPEPHRRVPEEQVLHPHRRRRRLHQNAPLTHFFVDTDPRERIDAPLRLAILRQSLLDLRHPAERLELGIGLFIDRPFGYGKAVGEPDYTPLLAHEAFSASI